MKIKRNRNTVIYIVLVLLFSCNSTSEDIQESMNCNGDSLITTYFESGQIKRETFMYDCKLCKEEHILYDTSRSDVTWLIDQYHFLGLPV